MQIVLNGDHLFLTNPEHESDSELLSCVVLMCLYICVCLFTHMTFSWLAFEGQDFAGMMYVLEVGSYPDLRAMGCFQASSSILSLQTVGFVSFSLFFSILLPPAPFSGWSHKLKQPFLGIIPLNLFV